MHQRLPPPVRTVVYARQGTPLVRLSPAKADEVARPLPGRWSWTLRRTSEEEERAEQLATDLEHPELDLFLVQPSRHDGIYGLFFHPDDGSHVMRVMEVELRITERSSFRLLPGDGQGRSVASISVDEETMFGEGASSGRRRLIRSSLASITFEEIQAALGVLNEKLESLRRIFAGKDARPEVVVAGDSWILEDVLVSAVLLSRGTARSVRLDGRTGHVFVATGDADEYDISAGRYPPDGKDWLAPPNLARYATWGEVDETLKLGGVGDTERRDVRFALLDAMHVRTDTFRDRAVVDSSGLTLGQGSVGDAWRTESVLETHVVDSDIFGMPEWLRSTEGKWDIEELAEHVSISRDHDLVHTVTTKNGSVPATIVDIERDPGARFSALLSVDARGAPTSRRITRWYLAPTFSRVAPEGYVAPVPGSDEWAAVPRRLLALRHLLDQTVRYISEDSKETIAETRLFDHNFADGDFLMLHVEELASALGLARDSSISFCLMAFSEELDQVSNVALDDNPATTHIPSREDPPARRFDDLPRALAVLDAAHGDPLPAWLPRESPRWGAAAARVLGVLRDSARRLGIVLEGLTVAELEREALKPPVPEHGPAGANVRRVVNIAGLGTRTERFDQVVVPLAPTRRLSHVFVVMIRPYAEPEKQLRAALKSLVLTDPELLPFPSPAGSLEILDPSRPPPPHVTLEAARQAVRDAGKAADRLAWLAPAVRNRIRARQFVGDLVARGDLAVDSSEWPSAMQERDAEVIWGIRRMVGSTDGYRILPTEKTRTETDTPFAPLLPGDYEHRVLFDRTVGGGLRLDWFKRLYRDMKEATFDEALQSIAFSDRESRLLVHLWTERDLSSGAHADDWLNMRYRDFLVWLREDQELYLSENNEGYGNPLQLEMFDVMSLLSVAQRNIERRCGRDLPCVQLLDRSQRFFCKRRCRASRDYVFRAHVIEVFWPRVERLVIDILPRLGLDELYPRINCLGIVALRETQRWKTHCGASQEDQEFMEHFFDIPPVRYPDVEAALESPSVARELLGLPRLASVAVRLPGSSSEAIDVPQPFPAPGVAPGMSPEEAILASLRAKYQADAARNRALIDRYWASDSPVDARAATPVPADLPLLRDVIARNISAMQDRHETAKLLRSLDIPGLYARATRIDNAMKQLRWTRPSPAQRGQVLADTDLHAENVLASARAHARADASSFKPLLATLSGVVEEWKSSGATATPGKLANGREGYKALNEDRVARNRALLKASEQLAKRFAELLRALQIISPTEPSKWDAAIRLFERTPVRYPSQQQAVESEKNFDALNEDAKRSLELLRRLERAHLAPRIPAVERSVAEACAKSAERYDAEFDRLESVKALRDASDDAGLSVADLSRLVSEQGLGAVDAIRAYEDGYRRLRSGLESIRLRHAAVVASLRRECEDYTKAAGDQLRRISAEWILDPANFWRAGRDQAASADAYRAIFDPASREIQTAVARKTAEREASHIEALDASARKTLSDFDDSVREAVTEIRRALAELERRNQEAEARRRASAEAEALRLAREQEDARRAAEQRARDLAAEQQRQRDEAESARLKYEAELAKAQADQIARQSLEAAERQRLEAERKREAQLDAQRLEAERLAREIAEAERLRSQREAQVGSYDEATLKSLYWKAAPDAALRDRLRITKTYAENAIAGARDDDPANYGIFEVGGGGNCFFYVSQKAEGGLERTEDLAAAKAIELRRRVVEDLSTNPERVRDKTAPWFSKLLEGAWKLELIAIGSPEEAGREPVVQAGLELLRYSRRLGSLGQSSAALPASVTWENMPSDDLIARFNFWSVQPPRDDPEAQAEAYNSGTHWLNAAARLSSNDAFRSLVGRDNLFNDVWVRMVSLAVGSLWAPPQDLRPAWDAAFSRFSEALREAYRASYREFSCYAGGEEVGSAGRVLNTELVIYKIESDAVRLACGTRKELGLPHQLVWNRGESHFQLIVWRRLDRRYQHVFPRFSEMPPLAAIDYLLNCLYPPLGPGANLERVARLRADYPREPTESKYEEAMTIEMRLELEAIVSGAKKLFADRLPAPDEIARHLEAVGERVKREFLSSAAATAPRPLAVDPARLFRESEKVQHLPTSAAPAAAVCQLPAVPQLRPGVSPAAGDEQYSALFPVVVHIYSKMKPRWQDRYPEQYALLEKLWIRRKEEAGDFQTFKGVCDSMFSPRSPQQMIEYVVARLGSSPEDVDFLKPPKGDANVFALDLPNLRQLAVETAMMILAFDDMFRPSADSWLYQTAYMHYIRGPNPAAEDNFPLQGRWAEFLAAVNGHDVPASALRVKDDTHPASKFWDSLVGIRAEAIEVIRADLPLLKLLLSHGSGVAPLLSYPGYASMWMSKLAPEIAKNLSEATLLRLKTDDWLCGTWREALSLSASDSIMRGSGLRARLGTLRSAVCGLFATRLSALKEPVPPATLWSPFAEQTSRGRRRFYAMQRASDTVAQDDMRGATLSLSNYLALQPDDASLWEGWFRRVPRSAVPVSVYDPSAKTDDNSNYNGKALHVTDVARVAFSARLFSDIIAFGSHDRYIADRPMAVGSKASAGVSVYAPRAQDLVAQLREAWFGSVAREFATARSFSRYALLPVQEVRDESLPFVREIFGVDPVPDTRLILWSAGDLTTREDFDRYWPFFLSRDPDTGRSVEVKEVPTGTSLVGLVSSELVYHLAMLSELSEVRPKLRPAGLRHPYWGVLKSFIALARQWNYVEHYFPGINARRGKDDSPFRGFRDKQPQPRVEDAEDIWGAFAENKDGYNIGVARLLYGEGLDFGVRTPAEQFGEIGRQLEGVAFGRWYDAEGALLSSGKTSRPLEPPVTADLGKLLAQQREFIGAINPSEATLPQLLLKQVVASVRGNNSDDLSPRIIWPLLVSYRLLFALFDQARAEYEVKNGRRDIASRDKGWPDFDLDGVKRAHALGLEFLYSRLLLPTVDKTSALSGPQLFRTAMFAPSLLLETYSASPEKTLVTYDYFDARSISDYLSKSRWNLQSELLTPSRLLRWKNWCARGDPESDRPYEVLVDQIRHERLIGRGSVVALQTKAEMEEALQAFKQLILPVRQRFLVHYEASRYALSAEGGYSPERLEGQRGFAAYFSDATRPSSVAHLETRGLHCFLSIPASKIVFNLSGWSFDATGYLRLEPPAEPGVNGITALVRDGLLPVAARTGNLAGSDRITRGIPHGYHSVKKVADENSVQGVAQDRIALDQPELSPLTDRFGDVSFVFEQTAFTDWMNRLDRLLEAHVARPREYDISTELSLEAKYREHLAELEAKSKALPTLYDGFSRTIRKLYDDNVLSPENDGLQALTRADMLPSDAARRQAAEVRANSERRRDRTLEEGRKTLEANIKATQGATITKPLEEATRFVKDQFERLANEYARGSSNYRELANCTSAVNASASWRERSGIVDKMQRARNYALPELDLLYV